MLLLLSCWIIAGITAGEPKSHYRDKNSSLCLQVQNAAAHKEVQWSFNNQIIIYNEEITPNFTDKVDYNPKDFELCINKLTEEDSGIYKADIVNSHFTKSSVSHRLIVQGTVPRPVIRMSVIHSNLSAGFCNVTVNCSVHDEWMCSVCDRDGCTATQRSFREVNITIFTHNWSIGCTGNNHVSKSNVSESMEAMCFNGSNPEFEETSLPLNLEIIAASAASALVLCLFIACVVKKRNNRHQTSPEPVEAQPPPVRRDSSLTSSDTEVCYENMDASQPAHTSGPTEEPESRQSQKAETVYCVGEVRRDGSEDAHELRNLREASTARPDPPGEAEHPPGEAEHPAHINTVYSVLQKPVKKR